MDSNQTKELSKKAKALPDGKMKEQILKDIKQKQKKSVKK